MALLQTKWIADDAVNDTKVKLRNNQALRARNAADTADIEVVKLNDQDELLLPAGTKIGGSEVATLANIPQTFNIQGNWDASTNTPALSDGVNPIDPLEYPLYIVSVSGATTLDGSSDWVVGDKLYFANGQWYKVDNNDAVASVNGQTGVVDLDSDDISEGLTNLFFTDLRVQEAQIGLANTTIEEPISGTDSVSDAFSKLQQQVDTLKVKAPDFQTDVIEIFALDVSNGFVYLSTSPISESLVVFIKGSLVFVQGQDYEIDAIEGNKLNLLGDLAANISAGDTLIATYSFSPVV